MNTLVGCEHWDRLSGLRNPTGYLYRVGQTAARRNRRTTRALPAPDPVELPDAEPDLVLALGVVAIDVLHV